MERTIITHLLSGDLDNIRYIFESNRNYKCFVLNRKNLKEAGKIDDLQRASLYFLFGEDNTAGEDNTVYVGHTENFYERIRVQNKQKEFWNEVLVFTSNDNFLNRADVQYLECLAIEKIKQVGNFNLDENIQNPRFNNLENHRKSTIKTFFQDVIFLCSFLNYNLFNKIDDKSEKLFFCFDERRGVDASSIYTGNKITVLKGSRVSNKVTDAYGRDHGNYRIETLNNNAKEESKFFTLNKDITFKSPSSASNFCLGTYSNGWSSWKDKDNKTLDDIYRRD